MIQADVLIVGGGMAGQTLAAALGGADLEVVLVERERPVETRALAYDGRTSAVAFGAMRALDGIGLWSRLSDGAEPILEIRVSDRDSPLFLHYDHAALGRDPLGFIVENSAIRRALGDHLAALPTVRILAPASVGVGTPQHLGGELFKLQAKVDMVHVPFRGATAAIPDVLAGRVQVFIGAINSLLPLIREGRLRALASAGASRIAALPDVPTMAEAGFPGVEVGSGVGLVAPAGTPPDVVDTLHRATADIVATPGFRERMAAIGVVTVGTTPQQYASIIREEYAKWGKVVKAGNIKAE